MKTLVRSISFPRRPFGLLFFCVLAFLPSIVHLTAQNFSMVNPVVTPGPVIAGFWLALGLREIRINAVLLGTLMTTLLWAVNWLMLAGHCCSTINE